LGIIGAGKKKARKWKARKDYGMVFLVLDANVRMCWSYQTRKGKKIYSVWHNTH